MSAEYYEKGKEAVS